MRLSAEAIAKRSEIERMCASVECDLSVAAWLEVPVGYVTLIRAECVAGEIAKQQAELEREQLETAENAAQAASAVSRRDLEGRCQQLKEAIELLFRKWERDNDMRPGAGIVLLPAGWSEQRRRAA